MVEISQYNEMFIPGHERNMARIGSFMIGKNLLQNGSLSQVMSFLNFIPIEIDYMDYAPTMRYTGISPLFRKLEKDEVIPQYDIVFKLLDGEFSIKAEPITTVETPAVLQ